MTWKDDLKRYWQEIMDEREENPEEPPDDDMPDFRLYPYLNCSSDYYRPFSFNFFLFKISGGSVTVVRPGQEWEPKITIWNSGNFPSWSCHVEVREYPGDNVKTHKIITLQPGESSQVQLRVQAGGQGTSLVGVCYEPLLDPYDPDDHTGRKFTILAITGAVLSRQIHLGSTANFVRSLQYRKTRPLPSRPAPSSG